VTAEPRRPTRQLIQPDLPAFDSAALDPARRAALAELLLTLADDEFVIGFRDSEWTGIAPMLEEDVAFSSLAQDEIGHARLWYEMRSALTGEDPDGLAFGRQPDQYRHARLLDHPRNGWAFTMVRRWLYDTADAVRLAALAENLRAVGARAEELPDGLVITGGEGRLRGRVRTHGDHRIAMAFAVLGSQPGARIQVDDPDCAAVSFPRFADRLAALFVGRK